MEIRYASTKDLIELARLNDQIQAQHAGLYPSIFRYPLDPIDVSNFFTNLIDSTCQEILVAAKNESLYGYLFFEHQHFAGNVFKFESNRIYIHHIAVDTNHRRNGIGLALFDHLVRIAEQEGIQEFCLDTMVKNREAQTFFEHGHFTKNKLTYTRQF